MTTSAVGAVALDVAPDLSQFRQRLMGQLRSINLPEINIPVRVNTKAALGSLRTFAATGSKIVAGLGVASVGVFAGLGAGLAGLGAGFLALGVKIASQNAVIKKTFTDTFGYITKQAAALATPFIGPLKQVAGIIKTTFDTIAPELKAIFSTLAPTLVPLVQGVASLVKALMPVFQGLATAVAPILVNLGTALGQLGNDLAGFLTPLIDVLAKVGGNLFTTLIGGIGELLVNLAPLLATLMQVGSTLLGPLLQAVNLIAGALATALVPIIRAIGPLFTQLVGALAPLIVQLITGLQPILLSLAPILSQVFAVLAPIASALISALQPAIQAIVPVIGLLVGAIGKILLAVVPLLVPLGQLIAQLVGALLPVLTPIINLIAELAAQLIGALVQALIVMMPSLKAVATAIASLLPALMPLLPMLAQLLMAVIPLLPPLIQLAATIITLLVPVLRVLITVVVSVVGFLMTLLVPAIQWLVTVINKVVAGIQTAIVTVLAPIFVWLYNSVIKPVWAGIQAYLEFVWAAVKVIFNAYKAYIMNVLAPIIRWLYDNVVKPVFAAIGAYVGFVWNNVVKPIWNALKAYIQNVLAPIFQWIYNNIVKPVFTSIGSHISSVWNNVIKPAFNAVKTALGAVGHAFAVGASAIQTAWSKVADYAKKPINFVIQTVYNKGIVGLWNKVMGWLHLPKSLQLNTLPALAAGGEMSAVQPMKTNRPKAIVGEGNPRFPEYVIPTDPKFRGRASALWAQAGGDMQMLAGGGILGGLLDTVKKGASKVVNLGKDALDFVTDPKKIFDKLASPVLSQAKGLATSPWGQAAAAIPPKILGEVWDAAKQLVGSFNEGYGTAGDANAVVQAAKTQLGVPYVWGGTSWGHGLDCSGLTQGAYEHGAGVHIPRVTYDQVKAGRAVASRNELRPGDLIFPHLGHVMMAATPGAQGPQGTIEAQQTGTNVMMSPFRGMGAGARRILDRIPGAASSFTGNSKDYARSQLGEFGWSGVQFSPLDRLWTRESNWNYKARNPSSGAYGIPQALPGSKMASAGADWQTNPATQVRWGLGYIHDRYGSPSGAWAHSQNTGWYAKGGIAPADSWGIVGEAGPELVRFGKSTQVIPHDQSEQMLGGHPGIGTVNLTVPEKASVEEVIHELEFTMRKSRKGGVYAGV
jgi:phage-related protein